MRFKNRGEAAMLLAKRLGAYKGQNPLILGVPRGAVPMARIMADADSLGAGPEAAEDRRRHRRGARSITRDNQGRSRRGGVSRDPCRLLCGRPVLRGFLGGDRRDGGGGTVAGACGVTVPCTAGS